jgi:hypothetical protein
MRARLLPSALLAYVLDFAYASGLSATATTTSHASRRSFLGDALVRHDMVQNVLEHEPAKVASCQQSVRAYFPLLRRTDVLMLRLFS